LQKVWYLANGVVTTEEVKNKLLLATIIKGNTDWQREAFWVNLDFFQKILDWAKNSLTT
jgi:hypothetical protein